MCSRKPIPKHAICILIRYTHPKNILVYLSKIFIYEWFRFGGGLERGERLTVQRPKKPIFLRVCGVFDQAFSFFEVQFRCRRWSDYLINVFPYIQPIHFLHLLLLSYFTLKVKWTKASVATRHGNTSMLHSKHFTWFPSNDSMFLLGMYTFTFR